MGKRMKIAMPYGASHIINELKKNGYDAYIVGGCVRDSLLNKVPNDWDITTNAKPDEIKSIFKRTVDTGIQHGTVTVLIYPPHNEGEESELETYEVTTYRVDGVYEDHRRPKEVTFTASLEEDLKRRDFTINAMAYNDETGVVDVFGGVKDLENKVVRCVGNPDDRFNEDALRILRAVRFSAQLGFSIDEATRDAISTHAAFLRDISAERIQVELTKLITSDNPDKLLDAYELGLTKIILPEFDAMMVTEQNNPYHLYSVGIHTIKVMENIKAEPILRYAALLHDVGKPKCKSVDENGIDHFYRHQDKSSDMARDILRRLKMDNNTIKQVCLLAQYHDFGIRMQITPINFRRFLAKLGRDNFNDFILVKKADMAGQSDYHKEERLEQIAYMEEIYKQIIDENHALHVTDLVIGGKELMDLGVQPGRQIGEILNALLQEVIDEPEKNNEQYLLQRAANMI